MTRAITLVPTQLVNPPRKLLLDTQIHRNLAYGRVPDGQVAALQRLAALRPRALWTCDIVIRELIAHIRPQEAGHFPHFREAFRWVDRLCGNTGMAAPLSRAVWTAAFGTKLPWPHSNVVGLNQWRRKLIKASTFADVPGKAAEFARWLSLLEKDKWSQLGKRMRWRLRRTRATTRSERRKAIVQAMVGTIESVIEDGRRRGVFPPGPEPAPDRIESELREFIHLHVKLLSEESVASYNFRKHATDAMDRWMLVYAGAGYTIVTLDQRLVRVLAESRCPSPRVLSLEEAVKTS